MRLENLNRWDPMRVFMVSLSAIVLSSIVLALSSSACGQSTKNETPSTAISTTVNEVSLDLFVHDKKHRTAPDLTPNDVTVTDAGVPVKLSSLRLVDQNSGSRLLTVLFDHLDSLGASDARKLAAKILEEIPVSGFDLSVLTVQGELRLASAFTSDRLLINRAVAEATQGSLKEGASLEKPTQELLIDAGRGWNRTGKPITPEQRLRAQVLLSALEDSRNILREQHPTPSLAALLALVRSERRLPGLKVIFFVSQDFGSPSKDSPILERIISSANRSGVKIVFLNLSSGDDANKRYMLDFLAMKTAMNMKNETGVVQTTTPATGALTQGPSGPTNVQAPTGPGGAVDDSRTSSMAIDQAHYSSLDMPVKSQTSEICRLAEYTGGSCIGSGENPKKTVRQLVADMETYYEGSFVSPAKQYGKFRPIRVKSLRSGLKIRARSGYMALAPESDISIQPFESPLLSALSQAILPHDLQFDSRVLQLGELGGGNTDAVLVKIPISQLETRDDPNTNLYSSHVSILAQIKDNTGQVIQHFAEDVPQHGSLDQKLHGADDSVRLQRHFVLDPGDYVLEVAVLDRNAGKMAAQRSTFQVADSSHAPFLSDLSLVARMEILPAEADPGEPLRYGDTRVIPELSGEVSKGQKQIALFSIVRVDPQSKEAPKLTMRLVRNGEPLAEAPLQLGSNGQDTIPFLASIQTSSLPAGSYQVVETLAQGASITERSTAFRIPGPEFATAIAPASLGTHSVQPYGSDAANSSIDTSSLVAKTSPLAIAALPSSSVARPSPQAFETMISAASKYALTYSKSLPNFICIEATTRSVDNSGQGNWKMRDSFAELLRYVDREETRTLVELNGQRVSGNGTSPDSALPISVGQFGGLLNKVFEPASKTSFEWQGASELGTETALILRYTVSPQNATMGLRDSNRLVTVGFHGLIYVDPTTSGIRRVTLEADDIPRDFSIRSTSMMVDYDYISIGTHEYLLPVRAALAVGRGGQKTELNEIEFRNYRRFASATKILTGPQ
jgi:VWFA-related protein